MDSVIKWSGSKRLVAFEIAKYFPERIETYYEPFLGSGAMLPYGAARAKKIVASDLCAPLVNIWKNIRDDPRNLAECYRVHWQSLRDRGEEYYYTARDAFNEGRADAGTFLFLTRTAVNGLVRFNRKGGFNASIHKGRPGIHPDSMSAILLEWSKVVKDVEFHACDYRAFSPGPDDFVFCDPPYLGSKNRYFGNFDHKAFFEWLKTVPAYALTFDGSRGSAKISKIERELYDKAVKLPKTQSPFDRYRQKRTEVTEMLYLKGV